MRRLNSLLQTNFISEACDDPINKTHFAYTPLDNLVCFVVAESYDNDIDINSAQLAVEAVLTAFERKPSLNKIKDYIGYAHDQLVVNSVKNRLTASVTVVVSDYTRMKYGVCGNTKLHIFHDKMFVLRSDTQTHYQNLIDEDQSGKLDAREVRNVLEFLGKETRPKPYISKKIELIETATILFSTCNLWETVSDVEMLDAYEDSKTNPEFLDNIQELFLSGQGDSKVGSYSVLAILIEKTFKEDSAKKNKRKRIIKGILKVIAIIGLITFIGIQVIRRNDRIAMAEINRIDVEGVRFSNLGNHARALEQYQRALALVERLNMNNMQYIDVKNELNIRIRDRELIFSAIADGELLIESRNYRAAQAAFQFVARGANMDTELGLIPMATEQLRRANQAIEALSFISIGEMYAVLSQYAGALIAYQQAMGLARLNQNIEMQRDIQMRILDINQRMQTKEDLEIAAILGDEEAAQQAVIREQLARIQALTINAIQAEGLGDNIQALGYFEEILAIYEEMEDVDEQIRLTHERIIGLNLAIDEYKEESTNQEVQSQVQKYFELAVSARRIGDYATAIDYYEIIVEIYREMNITGEQLDRVFEEILQLEQTLREELEREQMLIAEVEALRKELEREELLRAEMEREETLRAEALTSEIEMLRAEVLNEEILREELLRAEMEREEMLRAEIESLREELSLANAQGQEQYDYY